MNYRHPVVILTFFLLLQIVGCSKNREALPTTEPAGLPATHTAYASTPIPEQPTSTQSEVPKQPTNAQPRATEQATLTTISTSTPSEEAADIP